MSLIRKRKVEADCDERRTNCQLWEAGVLPGFLGDHSSFCTRCKALDVDDVFSHPERIKYYRGKVLLRLNRFTDSAMSSCGLCQLLFTICPVRSGHFYLELTAFSSRRTYDPGFRSLTTRQPHDSVLLGIVRRSELQSVFKTGYIASIPHSGLTAEPGFRVRVLHSKVDFAILRGWIDFCFTTHGSHRARHDTQSTSREIILRVIDCHTRNIVAADQDCEYLALSYVWGPAYLDESAAQRSDSALSLPNSLPATIEDAITVVLQLNYRYL